MERFPLYWPAGYKRTDSYKRHHSRFKQSMGSAQDSLYAEVKRIGGTDLIVSTNLRTRLDGGVYATDLNKIIEDPGVAIYFKRKGKDVALCCDQYKRVWENMYALACGLEALRSMERWGVSDFLDRAFTGFTALPESIITPFKSPHEILGISTSATKDEIKKAYLEKAKYLHPDAGGCTSDFQELQQAYEQLKQ